MESGDGLWVSPVTKHNSGPLLFSLVEQPESSSGGKSKEDVPGVQWNGMMNSFHKEMQQVLKKQMHFFTQQVSVL